MRQRPFQQVDVFGAQPYRGNPLAVVLDGSSLSDAAMQDFARWTNLSETTYVLPPTPEAAATGADYQVRIFTPTSELAFAGHPTLGSCHAWLEHGGVPRRADTIVQQCKAGLVQIRRSGTRLAFAAPQLQCSQPDPAHLADIVQALGLKAQQIVAAQLLDNGTAWLALLLDSPHTVLELQPDHVALKNLGRKVGVAGIDAAQAAPTLIARRNREARAFSADGSFNTRSTTQESALETETAVALEVRAFAAAAGIPEDPVTGSLNASLAQWLIAEGRLPKHYLANQGRCLERDGRVYITQDDTGQVWVGGDSVTCLQGKVRL